MELLQNILSSFGAAVVVPVMLFIVALFLKVKPKKSLSVCFECWDRIDRVQFDREFICTNCYSGHQQHGRANGCKAAGI